MRGRPNALQVEFCWYPSPAVLIRFAVMLQLLESIQLVPSIYLNLISVCALSMQDAFQQQNTDSHSERRRSSLARIPGNTGRHFWIVHHERLERPKRTEIFAAKLSGVEVQLLWPVCQSRLLKNIPRARCCHHHVSLCGCCSLVDVMCWGCGRHSEIFDGRKVQFWSHQDSAPSSIHFLSLPHAFSQTQNRLGLNDFKKKLKLRFFW